MTTDTTTRSGTVEVPGELVLAGLAAYWDDGREELADYDGDDVRFLEECLAAVLPAHERMVREQVVKERSAKIRPQSCATVSAGQAMRILGTDEAGIAQLVKGYKLTEMYTQPTTGEPVAIYNATELEALAEVQRLRAGLTQVREENARLRAELADGVPLEMVKLLERNERLHNERAPQDGV